MRREAPQRELDGLIDGHEEPAPKVGLSCGEEAKAALGLTATQHVSTSSAAVDRMLIGYLRTGKKLRMLWQET